MIITVEEAIQKIKQGEVVAVPTETVYGLAASLENSKAVEKLYQIKRRDDKKPSTIQVKQYEDVRPYVDVFPDHYSELVKRFWPGPLTLVLPIKTEKIPHPIRAGLATAAFRVPDHPIMTEILKATGPLVVPSANPAGEKAANTAKEVEEIFGYDFPVVDGGLAHLAHHSTILEWKEDHWHVLRHGALSIGMLQEVLGTEL